MNASLIDSRLRRVVRLLTIQALALLTIWFLLTYYTALGIVWLTQINQNDFGKFYYAVQNWKAGRSLYDPSVATRLLIEGTEQQFLDLNPPQFHLLVWPFAMYPNRSAALVWVALNIVAALVSGWWIIRELNLRLTRWHALPILAAVLLCAGTGAIIVTGQFTGLLMIPITRAWLSARRGRWTSAGAWLGTLISIKPFLAVFFLYLLIERRWRALVSAGLAIVVSFGIGLLVFGWRENLAWVHALNAVQWEWGGMNASISALWSRAFAESPFYAPVAVVPKALVAFQWTSIAAVALTTVWASRASVDCGFAAMTLGSLLISPLGWVYYVWLPLGPCLAVWRDHRSNFLLAVAALGLSVPLIWLFPGKHPLLTVTIGSAYTWGLLALWGSIVAASLHLRTRTANLN